ncbi:MAG: iron-containing alcohol dehydrogenase [Clostridia bacterium]|nr:iron-containing alcohol dehydrogenase [Clostridia bacterium]
MYKDFTVHTRIYFGEHALDRLSNIEAERAMIICDPFIVSSGLVRHITDRFDRCGIRYSVYSDVVPDPPVEKVIAGVKAALDDKPDCLVAMGGGSAMDLSKSIRKMAEQLDGSYRPRLIAIPTTSGTGSEVTSFAVITDNEKGVKYPLVAEDMTPDEAILDEELVKSVPPAITADTGMDVMTHAIESYVSIDNHEFSAALAEKAIEICGQFLLRSYADNRDSHARRKMHIASCLAGLAFNSSSLGLNHGMAHQLGAQFHIPHGRANAMLLPHIIEFNSEIDKHSRSKTAYPPCVRKYCTIARTLGVQNLNEVTTIRALIAYMEFMLKEMNIPLSISEMGVVSEGEYMARVDAMAEAALADACTATNPRYPTKEEIVTLYRKLWK